MSLFRSTHRAALIALIWLLPITAQAKLVAMVVGNEAYGREGGFQTLSNPIEDARDMAQLLKELGFTVTHTTLDADIDAFERDVNQFANRIGQGDTVVYYYSGHGVSSKGVNYLIPVPGRRGRGRIQDAADLKRSAIDASWILDKIALRKPATTIMILDACRDEMKLQETKGFGSESKGFSEMKATGSLIAYASSPGQSALGSSDYRNSVFTHFFLQQARMPENRGLHIDLLLNKVTTAVYSATGQRQEPWKSGNLRGEYCIGGCNQLASFASYGPVSALDKRITYRIDGVEFNMVHIPAGSFKMGSEDEQADSDEQPVHPVSLKSFYMMETEVTRGLFKAFVNDSHYRTDAEKDADKGCYAFLFDDNKWGWRAGSSWQSPGFEQTDQHPVVCISYNDAQAFVTWISKRLNLAFRLPSEAEWEYAATVGKAGRYFWGDDANTLCEYGNGTDQSKSPSGGGWKTKAECNDGYWFTAPVAHYKKNPNGLYDMAGNVLEWTQDCWNDSYSGAPNDGSAWKSGDCTRRVLRGGSWLDVPSNLRSAVRFRFNFSNRYFSLGFRLVQAP